LSMDHVASSVFPGQIVECCGAGQRIGFDHLGRGISELK
jgi:hypothetical protein